jgi:hypothetical protein
MSANPPSAEIVRVAARIKAALACDPSLAVDELRLAALIRDELRIDSKFVRIPASLRDKW